MGTAVASVMAVVLIVGVASFSRKLGVAAPLILVVVGLALSYAPGVPAIEVPHEWILAGVLPPLLYAAALKVPVIDFRRNIGAITSLSVVLVLVSALITGGVLYWMLPDLNLAAAIALGAVVSPPDAVAATSIGKRLGLPPRLVTVLEGEGLVNDATALVLLRSALAVAAGTMSGMWSGIADFGYAVVAAVAMGLLVGVVTVSVCARAAMTVKTIEPIGVCGAHASPPRFSTRNRALLLPICSTKASCFRVDRPTFEGGRPTGWRRCSSIARHDMPAVMLLPRTSSRVRRTATAPSTAENVRVYGI
jgi:NhaP-type Na+/H+ or K+/H+ antiporter